MDEKILRERFQRIELIARFLCLGVVSSLIVIFFIATNEPSVQESTLWMMRLMLGATVLSCAIFRKPFLNLLIGYDGARIQSRLDMKGFCDKLTVFTIISLAIAEMAALDGIILFFLGHSWLDIIVFLGASFVLFATSFPHYEQWQQQIQQNRDMIDV